MSRARRTALLSLVAALGLVAVKLAAGLATGSLGLLAEAAHSGVDAAAALITVYAIGVAERPPDPEHQYGHGKAQHIGAVAEALVLGAVAIWVAVEAAGRLGGDAPEVDATWYAFALMGGVLAVDAARAAASWRAGRSERSPALLANAWHFASDFVGTTAVIVGLLCVRAGIPEGDPIAALVVSGLVLAAAGRLAARNVDALMDRAPIGLAGRIERVARGVAGVADVRSVRVREAGGESFADVTITVPRLQGLERSHDTMDRVEAAVREGAGAANVTVHVEPSAGDERANDRVAAAALRVPEVVETHNITVLEDDDGRAVTLHARLEETMPIAAARGIVERLKDEIRREIGVAQVYVHVEPSSPDAWPAVDVSEAEPGIHARAAAAVRSVAGDGAEVVLYRQDSRLLVVTTARADRGATVGEAHALASRVEDAVREAVPAVADVIVEVV